MKKFKLSQKIGIGVLLLIVILSVVSFLYVQDYYRASDYVLEIVNENSDRITTTDRITVIEPEVKADHNIGVIFYPGGKVEATAYMPLLLKISDLGITTILIEMPANLAVFDIKAADDVFEQYPEVDQWFLAGHSLGGAMASQYMEENYKKVEGLILLGAYPVNDAPIETLAIYGTYDVKLDLEKVALANEVFEIKDGNHANFGDYGFQEGDGEALITREDQQSQAVERISEFIFDN